MSIIFLLSHLSLSLSPRVLFDVEDVLASALTKAWCVANERGDVDQVIVVLMDDAGDSVGDVAIVLDCTIEVVSADTSCRGDPDKRAASWDPARVLVLGDNGEGGMGTSGTASDARADDGGLEEVDLTRRGMGAVVFIIEVNVPGGFGQGRGAMEVGDG